MKINYIHKSNKTKLESIEVGGIFRFPNSRRLLMKLESDGESPKLTSNCDELWDMMTIPKESPFTEQIEFEKDHDYAELTLCVVLASGELILVYEGSEVEKLNGELLVEED